MGETTAISWTDHTFNPWWGCTRVSPGCENCYAETFDKRVGGDHWGPGKPRRVFSDKHWNEPMKWDAKAKRDGVQRKVFCASMADIFDEDAPDGQRERLWDLIRSTPNLIWQLLTKRPGGYYYAPDDILKLSRVWKGVTCEDQEWFNKRWPIIATLPGIRWVSYEPALGVIWDYGKDHWPDWVVFGGESGNGFRPVGNEWARHTKQACEQLGMKFFMKQWSARTPNEGKLLIPEPLNIQEFPA